MIFLGEQYSAYAGMLSSTAHTHSPWSPEYSMKGAEKGSTAVAVIPASFRRKSLLGG